MTPHLHQRSFAARYAILFAGELFSKVCVMAAFAYMAHVLVPSDYGTVELALAVTMFFVVGVEGGMGLYGARIIAASPAQSATLIPPIMILRGLVAVPAFLVMIVVARQSASMELLGITSLAVLLTPFLTQWVFQGLRQMQWVATGAALRNFTFAAIILVVIRSGADLRTVAWAEVAGVSVLAVFNSVLLYGRLGIRLNFRDVAAGTRRVFGDIWFMGLGDVAWACLWYSPALVIGWFGYGGAEDVAWVAAPVRIVVSLHTFVFLYFFNLLPNLAVELTRGVDDWRAVVIRSMRVSLWPAILIAVAGTLSASIVVPMVFGDAYEAAVRPFQIVIWMIPVTVFSGHFRFSLVAAGEQRREFVVLAITAVVTVICAVVFTAYWRSVGAAAAVLTGGLVNAVLAAATSHRILGAVPLASGLVPDLRAWQIRR